MFRESCSATTTSLLNTSLLLPHVSRRPVASYTQRLYSHSLFDDIILRKRRIVSNAFVTKKSPRNARTDYHLNEATSTGRYPLKRQQRTAHRSLYIS